MSDEKINTSKIEEAEISLEQELTQATETKTASNNVSVAWDFNEDVNEEPNNNLKTEQPKNETGPKKTETESKITDKAKRASARTAVNMINLLQRGIFPPILDYKFQKKFDESEQTKLTETKIIDCEKKDLEGEDLQLRNKFDRLMKTHIKKIADVPFTEVEEKDMEEAFYAYFDYKEKTLTPEWFIGMTIANTLGKRAIDVFTK